MTPQLGEFSDYAVKQLRGQKALVIPVLLARHRTQIKAGPGEYVQILKHDPGGLIIRPEMAPDGRRDFYGGTEARVRGMGNRHHSDDGRWALGLLHHQDNRARSILASFDVPRLGFIAPEVGIGEDETDFGFRKSHRALAGPLALVLGQLVELIVGRVHGRALDGVGDLVGQVAEAISAALQRPISATTLPVLAST